jgi:hypothetical protein
MAAQGIQTLVPEKEEVLEFKRVSNSAMDKMQAAGNTFSAETRQRFIRLLKSFREANR